MQIDRPTWKQIEKAIRSLDGDAVFLKGSDLASFTIGGKAGKFFAQLTLDGVTFHCLLGPVRSDNMLPLVVGNQMINVEERKVSHLKTVLQAVKTFADTETLDESLQWETV